MTAARLSMSSGFRYWRVVSKSERPMRCCKVMISQPPSRRRLAIASGIIGSRTSPRALATHHWSLVTAFWLGGLDSSK